MERPFVGGVVLVALGIASLLTAVNPSGDTLTTVARLPGLIVTGFGLGLVSPPLIDIVLDGVDPRDAGARSAARLASG